MTTEYYCEWLLCNLGELLQGRGRGYHVFLPQVVCQKRKPQIDNFFRNELHIRGQEKVHLIENQGTSVLLLLGTLYCRLVTTSY